MIIEYITTAFIGAAGNAALMWPSGVLEAIIAAPIGGSLAAAAAAAWMFFQNSAPAPRRLSKRTAKARFSPAWTAVAHG